MSHRGYDILAQSQASNSGSRRSEKSSSGRSLQKSKAGSTTSRSVYSAAQVGLKDEQTRKLGDGFWFSDKDKRYRKASSLSQAAEYLIDHALHNYVVQINQGEPTFFTDFIEAGNHYWFGEEGWLVNPPREGRRESSQTGSAARISIDRSAIFSQTPQRSEYGDDTGSVVTSVSRGRRPRTAADGSDYGSWSQVSHTRNQFLSSAESALGAPTSLASRPKTTSIIDKLKSDRGQSYSGSSQPARRHGKEGYMPRIPSAPPSEARAPSESTRPGRTQRAATSRLSLTILSPGGIWPSKQTGGPHGSRATCSARTIRN